MNKKQFIKLQVIFWLVAGLFLGMSAETMVNSFKEMIIGMALVVFCMGMSLMNFRLYEAEEE